MTFDEAKNLAKTVRWKTEVCYTGEDCWYRIIVPEEPIEYDYHDDK